MTGEHEAPFRLLYADHVAALTGYALRRVSAPEDAADVVAETFLVAWRRVAEVPPGDEARLWLYGVARRVLANQRRGNDRRGRLGERLRERLTGLAPDHADPVVEGQVVRDALARLGETDRELLRLTAWEGLEPREVATVLGLPARTVRTRLSRARARLRAELGDDPATAGHVPDDRPSLVRREER